MKNRLVFGGWRSTGAMGGWMALWVISMAMWLCGPPPAQAGARDRPSITIVRVDGAEVVVTVSVPAGVRKVTLESRTRLGVGAWVPRLVKRFDGTAQTAEFRLPQSEQLEVLRIRGDTSEPLPAQVYGGTTVHNGSRETSSPVLTPTVYDNGDGTWSGGPEGGGGASRTVVESDIWVIRGSTVYFFNQYRGLQVLDLTVPDAPVLKAELAIPASGEQMYVLEGGYALLLARDGCGWGENDGSKVLVVDLQPPLRIVAEVPVIGTITESRLVGHALYVASQAYRRVSAEPDPDDPNPPEIWEWGSRVTGIDLADPTLPVARPSLWYAGYGNAIAATDRYLFVAVQDTRSWWQSEVRIVDIAAPDGTLRPLGGVRPAGRVADKFKMHLTVHPELGDVLWVVSEDSGSVTGRRAGVLETYALANAAQPEALGRLEVGVGEGVYGTRFDGDRAYIVTFLRIDPLWVVDLRDPRRPTVSGELETPGWSTYIHPLGDRLVTVGIDNTQGWKVAVSLFDVEDPAAPKVLSRVPLGDGSSWSEANADEKAFTVLPEAGLILVPYQGWSDAGYAARVQLIDLGRDTLAARGVIEHRMQPRRATMVQDRIVSISGREVLVVSAEDRDHPVVTAQKELSWGVDRVLMAGDYLIECSQAEDADPAGGAVMRVAAKADPARALSRAVLEPVGTLAGAVVREGRLYVLQVNTMTAPDGTDPTSLATLTVFDLGTLPELTVLGRTSAALASLGWQSQFEPLWVRPGLLVWSASNRSMPYYYDAWRGGPGGVIPIDGWWWWPWWGWGNGRLLAFDVGEPSRPVFLSDVDAREKTDWWNMSDACTAAGLVYFSYAETEFVPVGTLVPDPVNPGGVIPSIEPRWVTRYFLEVVDYADPVHPTLRKPVNLPGQLAGLGVDGAVLFTLGAHYDEKGKSDGAEYLDALAYDSVSAALITSMKLPDAWPRATLVADGAILVARPDSGSNGGVIESWGLELDPVLGGRFVALDQESIPAAVSSLTAFGPLRVGSTGQEVVLLDATLPTAIRLLGSGSFPLCWAGDVARGDGTLADGLWVPLHDYGLVHFPADP
ncbi:MAG TPA: beta-propeller domain-containing protein [Verrucomicrobiota bacterium]|nr:beta-propeller domain-containing protein [Verrucomicrobiota bacterium]HNU50715.1 beta-propeller domain-containing protein [Verrucomicrobiota bacterium]